jgi:hypothetical protein
VAQSQLFSCVRAARFPVLGDPVPDELMTGKLPMTAIGVIQCLPVQGGRHRLMQIEKIALRGFHDGVDTAAHFPRSSQIAVHPKSAAIRNSDTLRGPKIFARTSV